GRHPPEGGNADGKQVAAGLSAARAGHHFAQVRRRAYEWADRSNNELERAKRARHPVPNAPEAARADGRRAAGVVRSSQPAGAVVSAKQIPRLTSCRPRLAGLRYYIRRPRNELRR